MFEYFFLIIWHVGKPKEPKKGTLKILPQNLNPPPGGPLWAAKGDIGGKRGTEGDLGGLRGIEGD